MTLSFVPNEKTKRGRPRATRFTSANLKAVALAIKNASEASGSKWVTVTNIKEAAGLDNMTVLSNVNLLVKRRLVTRRKNSAQFHLSFRGQSALRKEG